MSLITEITQRLKVLEPTNVSIIDESAQHAGHKGNSGGGHFKLKITSSHFCGKTQIMRHRLIYQQLSNLIPQQIHALSIEALTQNEI
ncbi:MAG: BolA family transcriptional regulator [Methylotenera sp.]|nr:BolA family transcriptional regulator [Methylotenera sp.]